MQRVSFRNGNELFLFFEIVLGCTAYGAFPVFGNVFPLGSGGYAIVGITGVGVIDIAAERANISVHIFLLPSMTNET
jgi:hypothetical protein